mmetsp:Transcript_52844/g.150670  ORF Transcript_52844/g.150670 Transcript_52844/m.150670 type:complete len:213 (-) Transcript_52844:765-1403(-)
MQSGRRHCLHEAQPRYCRWHANIRHQGRCCRSCPPLQGRGPGERSLQCCRRAICDGTNGSRPAHPGGGEGSSGQRGCAAGSHLGSVRGGARPRGDTAAGGGGEDVLLGAAGPGPAHQPVPRRGGGRPRAEARGRCAGARAGPCGAAARACSGPRCHGRQRRAVPAEVFGGWLARSKGGGPGCCLARVHCWRSIHHPRTIPPIPRADCTPAHT